MSEKITISTEELNSTRQKSPATINEKIIICEIPSGKGINSKENMPYNWYLILILPVLNLLAIGWACWQKKYHFRYPVVAVSLGLLVTFIFCWVFFTPETTDSKWKNKLAEKAQSGVVIIVIEDKGWFTTKTAFGTGVVVAQDGGTALILTNRHVVSKSNSRVAERIQVLTANEHSMQGELVALPKNQDIDMALLRVVSGQELIVLGKIGDFNSLKTGDDVVAIGHPNGLSFTMTSGIVSALRENMLIQSSASINPGNSGGPLLNNKGNLIGINTFFIKNSHGLNFAFRADYILHRNGWNYYSNISTLLSKISIK